MITTDGKVFEDHGKVYVLTTRPAVDNLSDEVEVRWHDSRMRSNEQLRKAFALMNYIGKEHGESKEEVYEEQRLEFSKKYMDELNGMFFHLSTATVSEASLFINFCISLIVENGIPVGEPLYKLCEDVEKYVYVNLLNKRCAVCGQKADLHHVDKIGMGYDRTEKPQIGNRVMPLCRIHHQQCHKIGETAFYDLYHLEPVKLDERLAKVYGLTKKAGSAA